MSGAKRAGFGSVLVAVLMAAGLAVAPGAAAVAARW